MAETERSGIKLIGGGAQPVTVVGSIGDAEDEIHHALKIVRAFHHEVHEGEAFVCSSLDTALADDGEIIFAMTPDTLFDHIVFKGSCGGDATIEFLEGVTITGGTGYDPRNCKRTESGLSTVSTLLNPTITDDGFTVYEDLIPGGTGGNAAGGSAGLREGFELIIIPSTVYAVRLKNIAGSAKPSALVVLWYEETDN
jgi:hypothetical protein